MQFKIPKNSEKYHWTQHAIYKLRQYGLSAQRVTRVINNPQRKEEGITPKTVAVMQPASVRSVRISANKPAQRKWSQEIWAMYQIKNQNGKIKSQNHNLKFKNTQYKIISAWRYPGVSPKRNPIPEEILREISELE